MVGTLDSCGASVSKFRIALSALTAAVLFSASAARGVEPTTASLAGTITAADLAQLGVTMTLTPQPYGISQTAMTDAGGHYSFTGLDPGCYTLQATSATFGSLMYGKTKAGTIFPDDTQILTLVAGQSKTGVDIDFATGHSFSGTLSVTTGTPPTTMYVGLTDLRGRMSLVGKFQAPGPYSFTHVPPGDYLVYGYDATYPIKYSPRYALSYSFSTATKYSLSSSDLTGANLSLEPAPHIKGQVTKPGGGVAANSRVSAYFRGQTYGSLSGTADGSGNYDLSGSSLYPTTQYRVGAFGTVADPFWGYEPDKMWGYAGDLNTAVAGDNTGHDIAAPAPGSVAGKVTEQGSATAISGATVQLVDPVSVYRLGYNYYSATTDASGNFLIGGVPYGRFQIARHAGQSVDRLSPRGGARDVRRRLRGDGKERLPRTRRQARRHADEGERRHAAFGGLGVDLQLVLQLRGERLHDDRRDVSLADPRGGALSHLREPAVPGARGRSLVRRRKLLPDGGNQDRRRVGHRDGQHRAPGGLRGRRLHCLRRRLGLRHQQSHPVRVDLFHEQDSRLLLLRRDRRVRQVL